MSALREAAEQALEALENPNSGLVPHNGYWTSRSAVAIEALRAALTEDGWRQCAEGQKTTQFCGLLEKAVIAEREACAMEAEYEAARWPYAPEARKPCEEVAKAIRARGQ